jgi:hypothetical protein
MSMDPTGPPIEVGPRPGHHSRTEDTDTNITSHAKTLDESILPDPRCRCCRCRRLLTAPLSVRLGAGPVCRRRLFDAELVTAVTIFTAALVVA